MAGLFTPQYNFFGQEMAGTYDPSLTKDAQAYAELPAGRGAVASAYQSSQNAANSFGNAIGGLFNMAGVQSPIQQKQSALQGIIGSINPQDPTSLQQAASQLLGMGMTTEAQQLMEEARKITESQSKLAVDESTIGLRNAQANAAIAKVDDESVFQQKVKYAEEKGLDPETVLGGKTAQAKMANCQQAYVQLYNQGRIAEANALMENCNKSASKGTGGGTTKEIQNAQRVALLKQKQLDNTITQQELMELEGLTAQKKSGAGEKAEIEYSDSARELGVKELNIDSVVSTLERLDAQGKLKSGVGGATWEGLKAALGVEDQASVARAQAEALALEQSMSLLPPGAASNADMQLVENARLGKFANPQAMIQGFKRMKELTVMARTYQNEKAKWIANGKSVGLFDDQFRKDHPQFFPKREGNAVGLTPKQQELLNKYGK